jgi:hypothetical protein
MLCDVPTGTATERAMQDALAQGLAMSDGIRIWVTDRGNKVGFNPFWEH